MGPLGIIDVEQRSTFVLPNVTATDSADGVLNVTREGTVDLCRLVPQTLMHFLNAV